MYGNLKKSLLLIYYEIWIQTIPHTLGLKCFIDRYNYIYTNVTVYENTCMYIINVPSVDVQVSQQARVSVCLCVCAYIHTCTYFLCSFST